MLPVKSESEPRPDPRPGAPIGEADLIGRSCGQESGLAGNTDCQSRWQLTLWPEHQRIVAVAIAGAWLGIVIMLAIGSTGHGGWIEIDQAPKRTFQFRIDLNQADWTEFDAIPGIGETLARRIEQFRDQHGPFQDFRQLTEIPGVGEKTLSRMRPFLLPLEE